MNVTPSRSHSSANAGSSATNPQPTHAASARSRAGAFEHGVVEVRARGRGAECIGGVRLTHELGRALTVGVQGDGLDLGSALRVELPDGVDEPHRGLSAVDDGDS